MRPRPCSLLRDRLTLRVFPLPPDNDLPRAPSTPRSPALPWMRPGLPRVCGPILPRVKKRTHRTPDTLTKQTQPRPANSPNEARSIDTNPYYCSTNTTRDPCAGGAPRAHRRRTLERTRTAIDAPWAPKRRPDRPRNPILKTRSFPAQIGLTKPSHFAAPHRRQSPSR